MFIEQLLSPDLHVARKRRLDRAREASWRMAVRLAKMPPEEREREIKEIDARVVLLAHLIQYPGLGLRIGNIFVRFSEGRDLARIYDILT